MKKIIAIVAASAVLVSGLFAMDMNIGLKGICGTDNEGVSGTNIGGGVDLNLDIYNGLGVEIESNICTSTVISATDGITLQNAFVATVPVMAWYNWHLGNFGIGAGLGLSAVIGDTQNADENFKMCTAAGMNMKYYFNDNFAIKLGVTGNIDVFPTLVTVTNGDTTTYSFVSSDFSKNSVYGSLGVEYRLPL